MKEMYTHAAFHQDEAAAVLEKLLKKYFHPNLFDLNADPAALFIDVGLNWRTAGHTLHWHKNAHVELVRCGLGVEKKLAKSLCRSEDYAVDRSAGFTEMAGFRLVVPPNKRTGDGVVKFNVYSTDKAHTYLPDGTHHAKFVRPDMALQPPSGSSLSAIERFCTNMDTLYSHVKESGVEGRARFEVRVPAYMAVATLLNMTEDLVRHCIVALDIATWW